ncbi:ABC transporter permease [Microbulbifer marinus]|uniref:Sodium transport system permease protein n=1 Tax=Microbulbifer marinus TaxID=658218 RepID=A0A1H4BTF0_9GAMM|nr:ABC transporter permease [Microbulbifer marinus]SEA51360.1 sodium transport system permease protein [Microbulbifer marinus]
MAVANIFSGQMAALLRKEFLEAWRDRRALWMAICFSLLFPVLLAGSTIFFVKKHTEETTRLALLGGDSVPVLEQQLRGASLEVDVVAQGEPRALLADGYDLVLQVGEDFVEGYRNFRAPKLYLYVDSSSTSSGRAERHLQERLGSLQQLIVSQRLTARGVAPQLLAPWQLQVRDISTPSSRGALILAMVPGLLILTLFVASLATSVDTSAGERERLSLETLLLQPLPGWQLIVAKTLAVASMGWLGALLAIAALVTLMPLMPLAELGIQQATTVSGVITMGLLLLPLALLVAVVQILLALRSQSFKDAQTQLSILQLAPVTLLMVLDMSRVELGEPFWQLVPLVGQQQWLKGLLVGDTVSLPLVVAGSLVCLMLVGVSVAVGARALRRESLLGAV